MTFPHAPEFSRRGFPKTSGSFVGVSVSDKDYDLFWDLYWGPPILGNCQHDFLGTRRACKHFDSKVGIRRLQLGGNLVNSLVSLVDV